MEQPSRRHLLKIATTTAIGLAGCVGASRSGGESTTSSEPLEPAERIAVEGEVLSRATEQTPLTLRYTITNQSKQQLTLQSQNKAPFLFIRRLRGESGNVVLIPPDSSEVYADGLASNPIDGCWRFVTPAGESATIGVQTDTGEATLPAGESYSVRHYAYYDGSEKCFPSGSYAQTTTLDFGGVDGEGPFVNVTHTLTIRADGSPSLQLDEPIPCESPRDCHQTTPT